LEFKPRHDTCERAGKTGLPGPRGDDKDGTVT
jgi:hypothetical protein